MEETISSKDTRKIKHYLSADQSRLNLLDLKLDLLFEQFKIQFDSTSKQVLSEPTSLNPIANSFLPSNEVSLTDNSKTNRQDQVTEYSSGNAILGGNLRQIQHSQNSNVSTPTVFDIQQTNINSDYINNYYAMSKISTKNIKSVGPRGFNNTNTNINYFKKSCDMQQGTSPQEETKFKKSKIYQKDNLEYNEISKINTVDLFYDCIESANKDLHNIRKMDSKNDNKGSSVINKKDDLTSEIILEDNPLNNHDLTSNTTSISSKINNKFNKDNLITSKIFKKLKEQTKLNTEDNGKFDNNQSIDAISHGLTNKRQNDIEGLIIGQENDRIRFLTVKEIQGSVKISQMVKKQTGISILTEKETKEIMIDKTSKTIIIKPENICIDQEFQQYLSETQDFGKNQNSKYHNQSFLTETEKRFYKFNSK